MTIGTLLATNVLTSPANNVLIPLELTTAASAAGEGIYKISPVRNNYIDNFIQDNTKIIKLVICLVILLRSVSKTITYEAKEQKSGFRSMLLLTLGAFYLFICYW